VISETQSNFPLGRVITDNIISSFELFHAIKDDDKVRETMATKLDMDNTYYRVG